MIISRRRVFAMETVLSKDQLDTTNPGYQPPIEKEEYKASFKSYKNKGENK